MIWLFSLVCIAPLSVDCGYADRMLSPLIGTASLEDCVAEGNKLAKQMRVDKNWVIVCHQAVEVTR